jgi:N-acetylglucosamine kinase-like BadF-type ATPase
MATKPKTKVAKQAKVGKVMKEYKAGELHSGSKTGPAVTNRKQAVAIAMSEAGMTKKKPNKKGY